MDYTGPRYKDFENSQSLLEKSKTFKMKRKVNPYYIENMNHLKVNIKNYESLEYALEKIGVASKEKDLQDQIIKHGQYNSVLEIQSRKSKASNIVVKQINDKLNVL